MVSWAEPGGLEGWGLQERPSNPRDPSVCATLQEFSHHRCLHPVPLGQDQVKGTVLLQKSKRSSTPRDTRTKPASPRRMRFPRV